MALLLDGHSHLESSYPLLWTQPDSAIDGVSVPLILIALDHAFQQFLLHIEILQVDRSLIL